MSLHSETNPYFAQPQQGQREGTGPSQLIPPTQPSQPSAPPAAPPEAKERGRRQQTTQPDDRGGFYSPWWPLKPRLDRPSTQTQAQPDQPQYHSLWEPPHPPGQDRQLPGPSSTQPQVQTPAPEVQPQPQLTRDRKDRRSQRTKPQDRPGQGPVDHETAGTPLSPALPPRPALTTPGGKKKDRHPQFVEPQGEDHQQQPTRQDGHRRLGLWAPPTHRTNAITWCAAVFGAIFSVIIFLGGLIVLIIYLLYRPRSPRFDIAAVSLNSAYLDAGYLLNADVTIYANFTNPNKKMSVDFRDLILDLYYGDTLISTQYIVPFSIAKASSQFKNVHLVTSQVALPLNEGQQLQDQVARNAVIFQLKGFFRVRSFLASFLKYTYKLHGQCSFAVTAPPGGILRAIRCRTKR